MRFAKYHGIGNDFVLIADPEDELVLDGDLARRLCDRRTGIGGDGVIRAAPGRDRADLFMDYRNSDGSVGEMCGNGIRCLALFAVAEGLAAGDELAIATRSGLKSVAIHGDRVRVDMGPPRFAPSQVPVSWDGDDALHAKVELEHGIVEAACLSMGNPHAVVFVDDPGSVDVRGLGTEIEHHPMFPARTNVEFVAVESPRRLRMRVWERGSGETMACGTGACAAAVAAAVLHGSDVRQSVVLPGGELEVEWDGSPQRPRPVLMTGPAVRVFTGDVDVAALGGGS